MSLKQIAQKIKPFYTFLLILLLLIDIYILGIIYERPKREVRVVFDSFTPIFQIESENNDKGVVLASKSGTKYYFPHCSGVNRIKEENIIYFSSEEEAISSGLEKAKNCE